LPDLKILPSVRAHPETLRIRFETGSDPLNSTPKISKRHNLHLLTPARCGEALAKKGFAPKKSISYMPSETK
jgi:hypothetical protein